MPRGKDAAGGPAYGEREVAPADVDALSRVLGERFNGFPPCLRTDRSGREPADAAAFDAAFAWLSANATGPWQWRDHVRPSVYVERACDQDAFVRAHGTLFEYQAPRRATLDRLAVLRGALPRMTGLQSFDAWRREHAGYEVSHDPVAHGPGNCRVAFSHDGMRRAFLGEWSNIFKADGSPSGYVGPGNARCGRNVTLHQWLGAHGCLGEPVVETELDIGECTLEVRYPDVGAALERDWGHAFRREPDDPGTFVADAYPADERRALPDDFAAWLRGERDDYDAPYLPGPDPGPTVAARP